MSQYVFGTGQLFAMPVGGGAPLRFGALQDVSVDFSGDIKSLHGQYQFPLDVARGKSKVEWSANSGNIDVEAFNQVYFGGTVASGDEVVRGIADGAVGIDNEEVLRADDIGNRHLGGRLLDLGAGHDTAEFAIVIGDGISVVTLGTFLEIESDFLHRVTGEKAFNIVSHDRADRELGIVLRAAIAGEVAEGNTILQEEGIVDRNAAQFAGDGPGNEISDHERENERVGARHLEDHDERRQGVSDDRAEERSHSQENTGSNDMLIAGISRKREDFL